MNPDDREELDAAFAAHKRQQARRALLMTPAERLRWLDDALQELGALRGLARTAAKLKAGPL
jgi:hypothetical protein